jgi:branched-chain amino acid transport system ATP-binding protein
MEIVRRYTERVLAFYDGKIIADGPTAGVLEDPEVVKYVVGEARPARAAAPAPGGSPC